MVSVNIVELNPCQFYVNHLIGWFGCLFYTIFLHFLTPGHKSMEPIHTWKRNLLQHNWLWAKKWCVWQFRRKTMRQRGVTYLAVTVCKRWTLISFIWLDFSGHSLVDHRKILTALSTEIDHTFYGVLILQGIIGDIDHWDFFIRMSEKLLRPWFQVV